MVDSPRATPCRPVEPAAADDPRILALRRLVGIVDRLRAPDGCPWDREQTEASMAPHVVEEAHELVEAIDEGDAAKVSTETGDLLLNVLLICKIAEQDGRFDLEDTAERTFQKLIRRHPHVFGDALARDAQAVLGKWEAIKRDERAEEGSDASALAGIPRGMPALLQARRVSDKAVAAGFRWRNVDGALGKLREELAELLEALPAEALESLGSPELGDRSWEAIDHELGDVLMATAFLAGYLGRDPEALCRRALQRFERRFRRLEGELGGDLQRDLTELEAVWKQVKSTEEETP